MSAGLRARRCARDRSRCAARVTRPPGSRIQGNRRLADRNYPDWRSGLRAGRAGSAGRRRRRTTCRRSRPSGREWRWPRTRRGVAEHHLAAGGGAQRGGARVEEPREEDRQRRPGGTAASTATPTQSPGMAGEPAGHGPVASVSVSGATGSPQTACLCAIARAAASARKGPRGLRRARSRRPGPPRRRRSAPAPAPPTACPDRWSVRRTPAAPSSPRRRAPARRHDLRAGLRPAGIRAGSAVHGASDDAASGTAGHHGSAAGATAGPPVWATAAALLLAGWRGQEVFRRGRQRRHLVRIERPHQPRRDQHHQLGLLGALGLALEQVRR